MQTGEILAERYVIERHLSKGGQGSVYLARDTRLSGRLCAIKRVSAIQDLTDTKAKVAQNLFQSEAEMLAKLSHPNLPVIYDFFTDETASYLVMEYIAGKTLQDVLATYPQGIAEAQVVQWAEQLLDVLQYLHSQNPPVIFRDLKPANVMLDKDGKIRLIDFGIARHFKTENNSDTIVAGTPGYLSPEGYGREQTDTRTDVYGLGVMLIVLLTGINPNSYGFSIPNPRQIRPDVSIGLDHTLTRAIALQKAARYQSMADFAQALKNRAVIEERTVLNPPPPDLAKTLLDQPIQPVVAPPPPAVEAHVAAKGLPMWAVAGLAMLATLVVGGVGLNWLFGDKPLASTTASGVLVSSTHPAYTESAIEPQISTQVVVIVHITATNAPTKVVPTATATDLPIPTDIPVIDSVYLRVGSLAKISYNFPEVNMRQSPGSVGKSASDVVTKVPKGETVHIIGGPEPVFGKNWWQVEWDSFQGWMAEESSEKGVILLPVLSSQYCSSPYINEGDMVQVAANINSGLSVRESPGFSAKNDEKDVIASIPVDSLAKVISGPNYADGATWWQITYAGKVGWIAEESLSKGRTIYACE